jgi:hypothetical protein
MFLLYELERINHGRFCRASFTAPFYYKEKFSSAYFSIEKFIIKIESGLLGHPLSLAAEIFLCAPISTATVERDFSTMNRILTDLRNRLTTEHLEQLMKISIEEPTDLDDNLKNLIIDSWKSKKLRRIAV